MLYILPHCCHVGDHYTHQRILTLHYSILQKHYVGIHEAIELTDI